VHRIHDIAWVLLVAVALGASACVDLRRPLPRDGGGDLVADHGDAGEAAADVPAETGEAGDADAAADAAPDDGDGGGDVAVEVAPDRPPSTLGVGLIGYWKLDDNLGTLAADSSGHHNDGAIQGIPGLATSSLPKLLFPDPGAFTFAAVDDGIRVPVSTSLRPPATVTVAAWVRLATPNNRSLCGSVDPRTHYLVHQRNSRSDSGMFEAFALVKQSDTTFAFIMATNNGVRHIAASVRRAATGIWYHVAGTFDGQAMRIYVDGAPEASVAHPFAIDYDAVRPLFLARTGECGGSGEANYDGKLSGALDDVRIYDRVLSAREVSLLASGEE
jgi:hypothetical protein